jgi:DNA-binding IclR family transcriptional regulator
MLKGEGEAWGADEMKKAAEAAQITDEEELRRAAILGLLKSSPEGLTAPELAKGSALNLRAVQRHLAVLVKQGSVESFGKARNTGYRLKRK